LRSIHLLALFFSVDPATTEIYTLSLHDALPISPACLEPPHCLDRQRPHDAGVNRQRPWRRRQKENRSRARAGITELGRAFTIAPDRKSTRLNSSHVKISYAVFCLKKKKKPSLLN